MKIDSAFSIMVINPHHLSRISQTQVPSSTPPTSSHFNNRTVQNPSIGSADKTPRASSSLKAIYDSDEEADEVFSSSDDEYDDREWITLDTSKKNTKTSKIEDDFELIDNALHDVSPDLKKTQNTQKLLLERIVQEAPTTAKLKNPLFSKTRLSHIIEAITSWIRGLNQAFHVEGSLMEALFPQTRTTSSSKKPDPNHSAQSKNNNTQIATCDDATLIQTLKIKKPQIQNITTLFPPEGISLADIQQGHGRHDCYFLSTLASILSQPDGDEFLKNLMEETNDNKVIVKFPNSSVSIKVEKTALIDGKGHSVYSTGAGWVTILEKAFHAYQILQAQNEGSQNPTGRIDRLPLFEGTQIFCGEQQFLATYEKQIGSENFKTNLIDAANLFQKKEIQAFTLGTSNNLKSHVKALSYGLMPGHAYAVVGIIHKKANNTDQAVNNTNKDKKDTNNVNNEPSFIIYNPYGASIESPKNPIPTLPDGKKLAVKIENGGPASGLFVMTASEVSEYFNAFSHIPTVTQ